MFNFPQNQRLNAFVRTDPRLPSFRSMAYRRTPKSQKCADLCPSITEAAHTEKTEDRTGIGPLLRLARPQEIRAIHPEKCRRQIHQLPKGHFRFDLPPQALVVGQLPGKSPGAENAVILKNPTPLIRIPAEPVTGIPFPQSHSLGDKLAVSRPRRRKPVTEEKEYQLGTQAIHLTIPQQTGVPAPRRMIEGGHVRHKPGPQGVEMNVPDELEEVAVLLANDRFVTVLEKMTDALVTTIEADSIPRQQTAHERSERALIGTKKEVKMIGDEGPGQTVGPGLLEQSRKPVNKGLPIMIIDKDRGFFDAPDDDMLQNTGDVQAGFSWHAEKDSKQSLDFNN